MGLAQLVRFTFLGIWNWDAKIELVRCEEVKYEAIQNTARGFYLAQQSSLLTKLTGEAETKGETEDAGFLGRGQADVHR